ncbi:hypothetical protein UlMin_000051 [Ulmus minor]
MDCVLSVDQLTAAKKINIKTESTHNKPTTDHEVRERSDDQPFLTHDPRDKKVTEELKKCLNKMKSKASSTFQDNEKPKIQKAPMFFRKHLKKYNKPKWISIGPIHHGKQQFQLAEVCKLSLAAKFIRRTQVKAKDLYEKIEREIVQLKNSFDKEVIESYEKRRISTSFGLMLFLDGCSMLEFIYSYVFDELKYFKIKKEQVAFAKHDFFLLENQIPFRVLKILMKSSVVSNKHKNGLSNSIKEFIRVSRMAPYEHERNFEINIDEPEPIHLLDLLRSALLQQPAPSNIKDPKPKAAGDEDPSQSKYFEQSKSGMSHGRQSFRNILDIRAAGITLKPSRNCSLRDIKFTSHFPSCLKLPPLLVDDSMVPKFMNLIAYEMCPDNMSDREMEGYEVTSYLAFMDSLIDSEEDVKQLRKAHILRNCLSSDAEVARLFNEMGSCLVSMPAYPDVVRKIQHHYENKYVKWMALISRQHFRDPWTILALVGAFLALALTAIGTWFTVFPLPGPCDNFCEKKH